MPWHRGRHEQYCEKERQLRCSQPGTTTGLEGALKERVRYKEVWEKACRDGQV